MNNILKLSILIFMLHINKIKGQNLVPNPSFEQYDTCPYAYGQINFAFPWTIAQLVTSPDYLNSCNTTNQNVPNNFYGYENARTGSAYALIVLDVFSNNPLHNNYREYLEVKLLSELESGIRYCIKFYVSAGDSLNYVSNDIGVYFSQHEIIDSIILPEHPLSITPQFENSAILNSRDGWTEVSGEYIASGGENHIIIGNFKDHNSTVSTYTGWSTFDFIHNVANYFIDDVSVSRCDSNTTLDMPNIFTPNGDGLNDLFIPRKRQEIKSGLLKIFNRWGIGVFSTVDVFDGWDGGDSIDGVYYWELTYTNIAESILRSTGYIVLIR